MASDSLRNTKRLPQAEDGPPVFFEMSGLQAVIQPTGSLAEMSSSLQCLLGSAIDILEKQYESLDESAFGALYLLRQAAAGYEALDRRAIRELKGYVAAEVQHG